MALQRGTAIGGGKTLIPPGRYWIDVFEPKWSAWSAYQRSWPGVLQVESTQRFQANAGGPARDFLIFKVIAPLVWDAVAFGYPTIAASSVKSSEDTVQRPAPEPSFIENLNPLASAESALTGGLFWLGALGLGAAALYGLTSRK
jgi:hypothetical protein